MREDQRPTTLIIRFPRDIRPQSRTEGIRKLLSMERKLVAITGAAGGVGRRLWPSLTEAFDLRLNDRQPLDDGPYESVPGDITDPEVCARICAGADTVVHLAADPSPGAGFDSLLPNNIVAMHQMLLAAKEAGVRRFVFASTIHTMLAEPAGDQLREDRAPRPANLYGASKVAGEALASVFAAHGLSVVCIRIGWYHPEPITRAQRFLLEAYVSERDLNALFRLAIDKEGIDYLIVNGISANRYRRMSLAQGQRVLGYEPVDDAFDEVEVSIKPVVS